MELAIKIDLQVGVPKKFINDLLERLNTLRREVGYPELSEDDLLPPPAEDDEQREQVSPAIGKDDFLRRHPFDEYNKVDRTEV